MISSCIENEPVRYNGGVIRSPIIASLKNEIDILWVCPEIEIGLGVPRESIRLVYDKRSDKTVFLQTKTKVDYTQEMNQFSEQFIERKKDDSIDGFILKSSSPSCGLTGVKVYSNHPQSSPIHKKGRGVFAVNMIKKYPHLAVEDEDRLRNEKIYDHFLNRIFTHARYRNVIQSGKMNDLIRFHSDHKYILMAYNQTRFRELGNIVANHEKGESKEVILNYYNHLIGLFKRSFSNKNLINVYEHMMGYFKNDLKSEEKNFFLDSLEQFRQGKLLIESLRTMINQWVLRFSEPYLARQVILHPYPASLNYSKDKHDKSYSVLE